MSFGVLSQALAETYIAGAIGATLPLPASVEADENINYPNPPGPGQLFLGSNTTIGLKESVAYGVKLGHYFGSLPWLGLETDVFTTTPHVMSGTIAIDTKSSTVGTFQEAQSGVHLRFTTWAFSLLARYPGSIGSLTPGLGLLSSGGMPVVPGCPAITPVQALRSIPPALHLVGRARRDCAMSRTLPSCYLASGNICRRRPFSIGFGASATSMCIIRRTCFLRASDISSSNRVVAPYWFFSLTDKSEEVFTISSATALLLGQNKPAPSRPLSGASCIVVSCGFRLSEVGLSEIRKPQVAFYLTSIGPLLSFVPSWCQNIETHQDPR
jgi:hypothetical protein